MGKIEEEPLGARLLRERERESASSASWDSYTRTFILPVFTGHLLGVRLSSRPQNASMNTSKVFLHGAYNLERDCK